MDTIAEAPESIRLRHKRLELLGTLDLVIQALFFQLYLYNHSLVELVFRSCMHLQLSVVLDGSRSPPSERPIWFYSLPMTLFSGIFAIVHLVRANPETRSPAALVDFVGIQSPASRLHMLVIDLITYAALQLFLVCAFDYSTDRDINDEDDVALFDEEIEEYTSEAQDSAALLTNPGEPDKPQDHSHDPYARPIFRLDPKTTYDRLTHEMSYVQMQEVLQQRRSRDGGGEGSGSSALDAMLTDVGRRYRERRARRGQPVGRAEDMADEERGMGLRLPGGLPLTRPSRSQDANPPEPG